MYNCGTHRDHCDHVHAFVDLNGIPYLLAEYLDQRNFQQIDRSLVRSEIFIDQRESMRAIIDISCDDIGKRFTDGCPAIQGNATKTKNLLEMIANNAEQMNHQFDVLKRGIIMRVNYQLENQRTGSVIRSMVEDLHIRNRGYFLDINSKNIDDNGVIVNFSDSLVSTVNEFTHGRDPMMLRITSVQMFYECLRRDPYSARIFQADGPYTPARELDYYHYHERMQNQHIISPNGCIFDGMAKNMDMISPPTWSMFNRYYHFDNDGHSITLHRDEIQSPNALSVLVPCGAIQVNRAFMINPGHRLIFKFSIWKNDLTVVSDTLQIAEAIKTPYYNGTKHPYETGDVWCDHSCDCQPSVVHRPHPGHSHDPMIEAMYRNEKMNAQQNEMLKNLADAVTGLAKIVAEQHAGVEVPSIPSVPSTPEKPPHHDHDHGHHHHPGPGPITSRLDELKKLLEEIAGSNTGDGCDHTEINQKIKDLYDEIEKIRNEGVDGDFDEKLDTLAKAIADLQSEVDAASHPQKIPGEVVDELIDKINNTDLK